MIRPALIAAALTAFASPVQAAAPVAPPAVQAAADPGVPIEAVRAWLTAKGGSVSEITREEGETWISIADGPLTWAIFFYGCQADVCGDIQYAASFSNPGITQAMVNDWNRDHRFLKAFFAPGEAGADNTAVVQYDLLIQAGDVEQLTDPTALWLEMVGAFATTVGYFTPPE